MYKKQNVIRLVSSRDKKWDGVTERRIKDRRGAYPANDEMERIHLFLRLLRCLCDRGGDKL